MGLQESFAKGIDGDPILAQPDLTSPSPDAVARLVDRIWEMPQRAGLPRCTKNKRQDLSGRIFAEQPQLTTTCVDFLGALAKSSYPRRPAVVAEELVELQQKEQKVQRIERGAERLLRATTDGALVQNGLLVRLNGAVLKAAREEMSTAGGVEREILASRWDAVFLLLDRRKESQEAGQKRLEKREAELLGQAEEAERSQAVDEALSRLRALVATNNQEGGRR